MCYRENDGKKKTPPKPFPPLSMTLCVYYIRICIFNIQCYKVQLVIGLPFIWLLYSFMCLSPFKCKITMSDGRYPAIKYNLVAVHNIVWKQMEFSLKTRKAAKALKLGTSAFWFLWELGVNWSISKVLETNGGFSYRKQSSWHMLRRYSSFPTSLKSYISWIMIWCWQ